MTSTKICEESNQRIRKVMHPITPYIVEEWNVTTLGIIIKLNTFRDDSIVKVYKVNDDEHQTDF